MWLNNVFLHTGNRNTSYNYNKYTSNSEQVQKLMAFTFEHPVHLLNRDVQFLTL